MSEGAQVLDRLSVLHEGLHAYFPHRSMGKYVDLVVVVVVNPGPAVIAIQIPLNQGEGLLLEAYGHRTVQGNPLVFTSLTINDQGVPGYVNHQWDICTVGVGLAELTPIDVWAPPASVVRVVLLNLGGAPTTKQIRLRGRIVSMMGEPR
jgi:hypothetical protein